MASIENFLAQWNLKQQREYNNIMCILTMKIVIKINNLLLIYMKIKRMVNQNIQYFPIKLIIITIM